MDWVAMGKSVGVSELEANIVPAATGADGLLATARADVGHVATDAGKGGVDATMVRKEHVTAIVPRLQHGAMGG
jgi:hypothetical protein